PAILMNTSSRCHLSSRRVRRRRSPLAYVWPNFAHHCRMLSWETVTPRCSIISPGLAQAQREAVVEPHTVTDDLRRESELLVRRLLRSHQPTHPELQSGQPILPAAYGPTKLTVPPVELVMSSSPPPVPQLSAAGSDRVSAIWEMF